MKVADEIPEANEENVGLSKGLKGHVVLDTGSALNRHSDGKDLDATPEVVGRFRFRIDFKVLR